MACSVVSPVPVKPAHIKFMGDPDVEGRQHSPNPAQNPAVKDGEGKYDKEFLLSFRKVFTSAPPDLEKTLLRAGLQTPVTSMPVKILPRKRILHRVTSLDEDLQQVAATNNVLKYTQTTTCVDATVQRRTVVSFLRKRTHERLVVMEKHVRMQENELALQEAELAQERMVLDQHKREFNKQKAVFQEQKASEKHMATFNQATEDLEAEKMQTEMEEMAFGKHEEGCIQQQTDHADKEKMVSDHEDVVPSQEKSEQYLDITDAQQTLDNNSADAGSSGLVYITGGSANVSQEDATKLINEVSGNTIHVRGIFAEDDFKTVFSIYAEHADAFWGGELYVMKELGSPGKDGGRMCLHFVRDD